MAFEDASQAASPVYRPAAGSGNRITSPCPDVDDRKGHHVTHTRRIVGGLIAAILLSAGVSYYVSRHILQPAAAREEAFDAIAAGQLLADQAGTIALPKKWRAASIDGCAYVTQSAPGTTWVLFIAQKGPGAQFQGYLFCTKPAAAQAAGMLEVNYPNPTGPRTPVTIRRVMTANCFEVINQAKPPTTNR